MTHDGMQVGPRNSVPELLLIQGLCPLDGIGSDLKSGIFETDGLTPGLTRVLGPGIAKILSRLRG